MKKIFLSALFLFVFLYCVPNAHAYDLEAQCSDIKCTLSSKDPIFPPDTQWTPNESIEKSINIKNISNSSKDIFLKTVVSGQPRALDKYMHITFFENGSANQIWMGTLEDLIFESEIPIATIPADSQFELLIVAKMDGLTPNEMQSQSSVFDFGFGFENNNGAENNGGGDNNSNSNNSNRSEGSDDSTGSENTVGAVLGSRVSSTVNNIINFIGGITDAATPDEAVLGERVSKENQNTVTGGITNQCSESNIWIVALVVQFVAGVIYLKSKRNKWLTFLQPVTFLVSLFTIIFTSCLIWPIILAILIFGPFVLKYFRKLLLKKNRFYTP